MSTPAGTDGFVIACLGPICVGSHDEHGQASEFSAVGREIDFLDENVPSQQFPQPYSGTLLFPRSSSTGLLHRELQSTIDFTHVVLGRDPGAVGHRWDCVPVFWTVLSVQTSP
jgi:hypothetical protein